MIILAFCGTTVAPSGISSQTTTFAPMRQFEPIFTPSITFAPGNKVVLSPICTPPAGIVT